MHRVFAGVLAMWLPLAAADRADFFELRVRPVLAKNCLACHAQAKMGGLELTSAEGRAKVITPGHPEQSKLIAAIRGAGGKKMPPGGTLSEKEIGDLESWVKDGAFWPEAAAGKKADLWSLAPVGQVAPPEVRDSGWVRTAVDRFVLAKLEARNLRPVEAADKRTWLRRATFDLHGLPPTPEEMQAFLADGSPQAQAKALERLLASPRYGERWARYWLDITRYADDTILGPTPWAWHYRDWVVRAFNDDMPYDLFLKAHLAADLLPGVDNQQLLPALTPFLDPSGEFTDDDRVDMLGRGFLGLTLGCAACHDHKYDPVPTRDFYSLFGVFKNTRNREVPLAPQAIVEDYQRRKEKLTEIEASLTEFQAAASQQVGEMLAAQTAEFLLATAGYPQKDLDAETLERWNQLLARPARQHRFLDKWLELTARKAGEAELRAEGERLEEIALDLIRRKKAADDYNKAIALGAKNSRDLGMRTGKTMNRDEFMFWQDLMAIGNPRAVLVQPDAESDGIYRYRGEKAERFLTPAMRAYLDELRARVKQAKAELPPMYPHLMVIEDVEEPKNYHVYVRGNPENLGEEAPRQFLSALAEGKPAPFRKGSGRLELAEAVANRNNPLTARVFVNRVWAYHFGRGIVSTPSNFGQNGARPTHPELLDWLAAGFMQNGWSVKWLHRQMMLSATYGLKAEYAAANQQADPDNRLLWRYSRRRLDVEALRDSMLFVTGALEEKLGGEPRPFGLDNQRRSIYGHINRQRPDTLLGLFDFPNPNVTSEERVNTTVPLQRLFLLNSDFAMQYAERLAARLTDARPNDDAGRIRLAYQLLFQREPQAWELERGLNYLEKQGRWPLYAQALMSSNEFLYVD
jgi:mono/diheme cytochrome c family protein